MHDSENEVKTDQVERLEPYISNACSLTPADYAIKKEATLKCQNSTISMTLEFGHCGILYILKECAFYANWNIG
jgi:hypothetical protein